MSVSDGPPRTRSSGSERRIRRGGLPGGVSPQMATLAVAGEIARLRRELVGRSLQAFCRCYLGHRFTLPMGPMHLRVIETLEKLVARRDIRLALAMPAEHGKTTLVTIGHALWRMCVHRLPHIVVVCGDETAALELITEFGMELGGNEALLREYPFAAAKNSGGGNEIVTKGGQRIATVVAGERLLGRRRVGPPPSLLICDDVEQWELFDPWREHRRKGITPEAFRDWLGQAMATRLAPGANVIVAGSIPAYEAYFTDLVDPDTEFDWLKVAFGAVTLTGNNRSVFETFRDIIWSRGERGPLGHGVEAGRAFYEANKAALLDYVKTDWPAKWSLLDLMVAYLKQPRRQQRCHLFTTRFLNEPTETVHTRAPAPAPLVYHEGYKRTKLVPLTDTGPGKTGWIAYDPEHTPKPGELKAPKFYAVIVDDTTGAGEVKELWAGHRRIHSARWIEGYHKHVRAHARESRTDRRGGPAAPGSNAVLA